MTADLLGTVAIVGFPNVGKSTLVNRLSATRQAVVFETPGVTRDRKEIVCEWSGSKFLLVDTGGVDLADSTPMTQSIAEQARRAVEEADLVLFVVDAQNGVTPGDEEIADILRRSSKPVVLLANKIDDPRRDESALEFHSLGLGDPLPVSAVHGHNTGDLLDRIVDELRALGAQGRAEVGEDAIRVAILGRPNVGKSSLLNAIVGEERVIVSEKPGTTRDAIDTIVRARRPDLRLRGHGRAAAQAQAAAGDRVLLGAARDPGGRARRHRARPHRRERGDGRPGPPRRRRSANGRVLDARRSCPSGTSRTIDVEDIRPVLEERMRQRPPLVAVSAQVVPRDDPHAGQDRRALRQAHRAHPDARAERLPPGAPRAAAGPDQAGKGRRLNLLYGTQTTVRPPRFKFFVNDPSLMTRDYGYWVENRLRERFGLSGVPVVIDFAAPHMKIAVVGGGSWGSAFAALLAERGHETLLACRDPEQAQRDRRDGPQPALPDRARPLRRAGRDARRSGAWPTRRCSRSPCRAAPSAKSSPRSLETPPC